MSGYLHQPLGVLVSIEIDAATVRRGEGKPP
ncbi:hypothetical protein STBA_29880 [Streptomyces sp. MP131-18]|nr:hypothetical protein STBA_29880 [Streptomyces sp. MP131-18]